MHLVNWKSLITSKKEGMDRRKLEAHNQSLLLKWLWRYNSERDAFWS